MALGIVGFLVVNTTVEASVVSFKAIKKNDVTITPGVCNLTTFKCTTGPVGNTCANNNDCPIGTNNLAVLGGDKIEVNLFLSNWINDFPVDGTPNNVRVFQVKLNRAGFVSNDNGTAKPLGWCGPVDKINCTQSATCPPAYPICLTDPSTGCTCSPHNPELGGFIDTLRQDFLFFGPDWPPAVCVTSAIEFKYLGHAENGSVEDTGVPRYLGTLIVTVSPNACGTFTIGFVQEITSTFIADPATIPNVVLPSLQPLTLTVSDCSRQLLSCNPAHCNIDARIAHDRLDPSIKFNTNQMAMTFSKSTTSPNMTAADFEVTLIPYDPVNDILPSISAVFANGADRKITTIFLNRRIQQTRWTCIRDKGSNKRCCMGSLPGDVDGDRSRQLDDTFELYDNLYGFVNPALAIEKCDIDRSLRCTPADLLMVVDLLNDEGIFCDPGPCFPTTLPACPSMIPPP